MAIDTAIELNWSLYSYIEPIPAVRLYVSNQASAPRHAATARTLAFGVVGAVILFLVDAPVPWLLGSLLFVMTATLAGVKTNLPRPLRDICLAILGTAIGAGFRPNLIGQAIQWLPTLIAMLAVVALVTPLAYVVYRRISGWSKLTAALAAIPGGFSAMALTAEDLGGDVSKVSMAHMLRIVSVILLMPVLVGWLDHAPAADSVVTPAARALPSAADVFVLLGCAVVGPFVGRLLRLPAAVILGSMLLSAVIHWLGLSSASVPRELIFAVQVVTGSWLGASFFGISRAELSSMIKVSLLVTALTLIPSIALACVAAAFFDYNLLTLILAFAPGGMPEMALIALSLDLDPMFVIGHHLVRMLILVVLGPVLLPWLLARKAKRSRRS